MQCACSILQSLACLALHYFSTLTHKRQAVLIFSATTVWNISHSKKKWVSEMWSNMYIGLYVSIRHSGQILMKLEFSRQIFKKYSNIKFHENPSIGSRVVPWGRMNGGQTYRQTARYDEAKVAFRNFANATKNECKTKRNNNKLNRSMGKLPAIWDLRS